MKQFSDVIVRFGGMPVVLKDAGYFTSENIPIAQLLCPFPAVLEVLK